MTAVGQKVDAGRRAHTQLALRDAAVMDIVTLADAPAYDRDRVVAKPFLEGSHSNVRVIGSAPARRCPRTPTGLRTS